MTGFLRYDTISVLHRKGIVFRKIMAHFLDRLKEQLFYYHNATDIPLELIAPTGESIQSFPREFKYCNMVRDACRERAFCTKIHKEGQALAKELKDCYIFSCPAGLIHFAVPVTNGGKTYTILAGPVAVDYPDISVVDDVIKGYTLSINLRGKLYSALHELPIIEPVRIQHLSKLLFVLVNHQGDSYTPSEDRVLNMEKDREQTKLPSYTSMSVVIPILQKAVAYIDAHYAENLRLENVAAHVSLNPSYFSTIFKRELKISFSDYLTQKRIEEACRLLLESNLPLLDIAAAVGFENQSYFSQSFRKHTGLTPTQYRKGN